MIFCTSIAPKHIVENAQLTAINSWSNYDVYSFNSKEEISALKSIYPTVKFIECETLERVYGKQYASIDFIFNWFKNSQHDKICLINSDIILHDANELERVSLQSDKGLIFFNRYDMPMNKRYEHGFDVFIIDKQYSDVMPKNIYSLGNCHFDYHIPFSFVEKNIAIFRTQKKVFEHVAHPQQYNNEKWLKTGRHMQWLCELWKYKNDAHGIGQMSEFIRQRILHKTQWI
jgi:hypothetical protein